ncbi:MAG: hypothetical protein ABIS03_10400 [Gemmatimonadaceae bacterium]
MQLKSAPAAPVAPAAPAKVAPSTPAPVTVTFTGVDGATQVLTVPLSRQDVSRLRSQREELSNQLTSASGRRERLSKELKTAPEGASRTGLEERMTVLDKRIVQLESDIAATGQQLSAAPEGLLSTTGANGMNDIPDNVVAIVSVFTIFVLFPMALAVARSIWKRTTNRSSAPVAQFSPQIDQRLERLEQGVDTIAIEIERVTEGQRFVTKLLSEQATRERLPLSSG